MEAMLSHRPFRRQLGLEQALAQLRQYRGSIYDSQVVDACLTLYRARLRIAGQQKKKLSMDAPVTSLPHSAFTLQAVIRQLPDRVIIKDTHSTFITCNQLLPMIWGCHRVGCRQDRLRLFPAELAASYQADDHKVIASGQPIRMEEPYMLDGQPHWLETSKSPIFDADGQCIGLTAIFKDITQQKQDHEKCSAVPGHCRPTAAPIRPWYRPVKGAAAGRV
jgi:PAS domain S-box-containing protein